MGGDTAVVVDITVDDDIDDGEVVVVAEPGPRQGDDTAAVAATGASIDADFLAPPGDDDLEWDLDNDCITNCDSNIVGYWAGTSTSSSSADATVQQRQPQRPAGSQRPRWLTGALFIATKASDGIWEAAFGQDITEHKANTRSHVVRVNADAGTYVPRCVSTTTAGSSANHNRRHSARSSTVAAAQRGNTTSLQ